MQTSWHFRVLSWLTTQAAFGLQASSVSQTVPALGGVQPMSRSPGSPWNPCRHWQTPTLFSTVQAAFGPHTLSSQGRMQCRRLSMPGTQAPRGPQSWSLMQTTGGMGGVKVVGGTLGGSTGGGGTSPPPPPGTGGSRGTPGITVPGS